MSRQISVVLSVLLALILARTPLTAKDFEDAFGAANRFYEQKDYDSAIASYEAILINKVESASLYFNLGNAHFKKGDLGHAIANYMKARRLAPDDDDIRSNLEFARSFSRVQMEGVELNPVSSFVASLVERYPLQSLAWLSSFCFILFVTTLIVRFGLGQRNGFVKFTITTTLLIALVSGLLTTYKYRDDYITRRAVIVAEQSPVYTGASEQSDLELEGAPGLIVEIIDESGDYYNVLFENKRRGWIQKDLIAVI